MNRFVSLTILGFCMVGALASHVRAEEQKFGGVGLQVVPTITGDLVVLNVLENAPAAEKGLLPGDLIFQVDDFPLQGSDFGTVVSEHLWGPVGSDVEVFYRRPGVAGVSRVILERASIDPRLTVTPTALHGSTKSAEGN
jgi:C-terminal processing protease CtpA/Prc